MLPSGWSRAPGGVVTLAAFAGVPTYETWVTLATACDEDWRTLDLVSQDARPFECELTWQSGTYGNFRVFLTVPRETRVCIRAQSFALRAANLSSAGTNTIAASMVDGRIPTENDFEIRGTSVIGTTDTVPVPRWAKDWRFETVGAAALGATLRVVDGAGVVRNELLGTAQPSGGWSPVGDAAAIQIVPVANAEYRLVFRLHL
jgi:hypothetical protein